MSQICWWVWEARSPLMMSQAKILDSSSVRRAKLRVASEPPRFDCFAHTARTYRVRSTDYCRPTPSDWAVSNRKVAVVSTASPYRIATGFSRQQIPFSTFYFLARNVSDRRAKWHSLKTAGDQWKTRRRTGGHTKI